MRANPHFSYVILVLLPVALDEIFELLLAVLAYPIAQLVGRERVRVEIATPKNTP